MTLNDLPIWLVAQDIAQSDILRVSLYDGKITDVQLRDESRYFAAVPFGDASNGHERAEVRVDGIAIVASRQLPAAASPDVSSVATGEAGGVGSQS